MRVGVTLGTRPEIIKLAPVIQELCRKGVDHCVIHTNQHYDALLDRQFFEELELPAAEVNLNVGSGPHGRQTARMLEAIEDAIVERELTHMVVQGDTNSGLAGALAASKVSCRVVHVEAGLRSYDARMPEELNRRLIDHISDELFPPTQTAREVLRGEAVVGRVHEPTGNTAVDAVLANSVAPSPGLDERDPRILLTLHRPENVDDEATLRTILTAVGAAARRNGLAVTFPAHPRTLKRIEQFGFSLPAGIEVTSPQSFGDTLRLQATARLVVTDSGGLQEEACVLRTPCVVVRTHTDRPEALEAGSALLAGTDEEGVVALGRADARARGHELAAAIRRWDRRQADSRGADRRRAGHSRRHMRPAAGGRRLLALACVCVGAGWGLLVGGCGSDSSQPRPQAGFWGVVPQSRTSIEQLRRLKRGGIDSVRIGIDWRAVMPTEDGTPAVEGRGRDRRRRDASRDVRTALRLSLAGVGRAGRKRTAGSHRRAATELDGVRRGRRRQVRTGWRVLETAPRPARTADPYLADLERAELLLLRERTRSRPLRPAGADLPHAPWRRRIRAPS